jgi:hypothetical protein
MMATDAGNRAIADQPDGSGAAARKRLNAKRAQAPRLLIVSANAARFRGYEAIAAEYPDTELIIAGSMLLPAIKRTGAVYLLITKRMAEQDAMMILKKQWERNAFNVDLRRCYWIPIDNVKAAVNSHADELSAMLFALALKKFGMTKLIRRLVKGLPDSFEEDDEMGAAREMCNLIFKAEPGFK